VKLVRLRRPKIGYFPSYENYRSKINAVILLDIGHTQGETTHRRNRERKGNLKLECGGCAHGIEENIVI
jgi:hypothetical protein